MKSVCIDCGNKCSGKRCRTCHIKFSGSSFDFGRWHFDTKKELDITVKYLLNNSSRNVEFENEFFKELINTYHKGVNYAGLKVTKFKIITSNNQVGKWEYARDKFRGNILVTGYFEPVGEWHGVTLYPYKKSNVKSKLKAGLREKWAESAPKREEDQLCEGRDSQFGGQCQLPFPQLHHDNISFKKIAEKCMKFFTQKELDIGIGNNWWKQECLSDDLPNNHPAVIEMFRLHEDVTYKWLCYECHKIAHRKKKHEGDTNEL